jgi:probable addiction module antidote protein
MTKRNPLSISTFDAAEYLHDEESIAEYLSASIEMNDPAVLLNAIGTVARARGMSQLAEASGLGRESLYKALKPGASPRYETVMKVLSALGLEMVIRAPAKPSRAVAGKKARAVAKVEHAKPRRKPASELRAAANDGKKSGKPSIKR